VIYFNENENWDNFRSTGFLERGIHILLNPLALNKELNSVALAIVQTFTLGVVLAVLEHGEFQSDASIK